MEIRITRGPAASEERVAEAILLHQGMPPADVVPSLGQQLPADLIHRLQQRVNAAVLDVTSRYSRLGSEERTTGALFDKLDGNLAGPGWNVSLSVHHYSPVVKENVVGADAGVIIDIKADDGRRVYKSLLVQAKRHHSAPQDADRLPGVRTQRDLMRRFTTQGYVWVYTPTGVLVYGPDDTRRPLEPGEVLADALRCTRGDREPRAIANTFDSQHVLEVLVNV